MKSFHPLILAFGLGLASMNAAAAPAEPPAAAPSAPEVMTDLKAGNKRFVDGKPTRPHADQARIVATSTGQTPEVTVLTCSDSRVPPEILFDQGIGDVFDVRVAGNVAGPDELGTIEYGTEHLHTPLLVVLGHTKCGAVTAAVDNASLEGSIPQLIGHIRPAVERVKGAQPTLGHDELVSKVIRENVFESMAEIFRKSAVVRHLLADGKLTVVGAIYNLQTGEVEWLGPHPQQAQLAADAPH